MRQRNPIAVLDVLVSVVLLMLQVATLFGPVGLILATTDRHVPDFLLPIYLLVVGGLGLVGALGGALTSGSLIAQALDAGSGVRATIAAMLSIPAVASALAWSFAVFIGLQPIDGPAPSVAVLAVASGLAFVVPIAAWGAHAAITTAQWLASHAS